MRPRFVCVLDFEATCDNGRVRINGRPVDHEIIEFPSVLYELTYEGGEDAPKITATKIAELEQYVRTLDNPVTKFCTKLTGITPEHLIDAPAFPEAMERHWEWLKELIGHRSETCVIMTCGEWDLEYMLPKDLARWGMDINDVNAVYRRFCDIKSCYMQVYGRKGRGLAGMISELGLEFEGRQHSGIDDCRNTGRVLERLCADGLSELPVTKVLSRAERQELQRAKRRERNRAHRARKRAELHK